MHENKGNCGAKGDLAIAAPGAKKKLKKDRGVNVIGTVERMVLWRLPHLEYNGNCNWIAA